MAEEIVPLLSEVIIPHFLGPHPMQEFVVTHLLVKVNIPVETISAKR